MSRIRLGQGPDHGGDRRFLSLPQKYRDQNWTPAKAMTGYQTKRTTDTSGKTTRETKIDEVINCTSTWVNCLQIPRTCYLVPVVYVFLYSYSWKETNLSRSSYVPVSLRVVTSSLVREEVSITCRRPGTESLDGPHFALSLYALRRHCVGTGLLSLLFTKHNRSRWELPVFESLYPRVLSFFMSNHYFIRSV